MTANHDISLGDIVRIGNGYQRWSVARREGDQLILTSDPSRSETAGSPSRTKQTTTDRVTILETAWDIRVKYKAHEMGIDPEHCSGCRDTVEWQLRSDDGDIDTCD